MKTLIGADNNNLGGEEEEDACTMRTHAGIISRNIFVALFFFSFGRALRNYYVNKH